MRLLVPAYGYPASARDMWRALAGSGETIGHVIINPGSGPGHVRDPEWVDQVRILERLGIPLLGYMDLGYSSKPLDVLVGEAALWQRWYGIVSYFLDCAPSSDVAHTGDVADLLRTTACAQHLTANAGTRTSPEVALHFDAVVEHEGSPSAPSWLAGDIGAGATAGTSAARAWIVHSAAREAAGTALNRARRAGVSEIWVTDGSGENPYGGLPSYWPWLLEELRQGSV